MANKYYDLYKSRLTNIYKPYKDKEWLEDNEWVDVEGVVNKYPDVPYFMFIGSRGNGKSFGWAGLVIKEYFQSKDKKEVAYVRRWDNEITGQNARTVFDAVCNNGLVKEYSKGKWDSVYYYGGRYYFTKTMKDGTIKQAEKPFCYSFAINQMEKYKSTSYPNIKTMVVEEFLSYKFDVPGEFDLFQNLISTIFRDPKRKDVKIIMCANTVNFDSVYFANFGIENPEDLTPGEIYHYKYGESSMELILCYTLPKKLKEEDNRLLAFGNAELGMMIDGSFQMHSYPTCPTKYMNKDVKFRFFIDYHNKIMEGEVIKVDKGKFLFFHKKSTPIKNPDKDLVYSDKPSIQPNRRVNLLNPIDNVDKELLKFFDEERVFYQDNLVGTYINNYLEWCRNH